MKNTTAAHPKKLVIDETFIREADRAIFDLEYAIFLTALKKKDPCAWRLVADLQPYTVYWVQVKHGADRFELKFSNSYYIKITQKLFLLFPDKSKSKRAMY